MFYLCIAAITVPGRLPTYHRVQALETQRSRGGIRHTQPTSTSFVVRRYLRSQRSLRQWRLQVQVCVFYCRALMWSMWQQYHQSYESPWVSSKWKGLCQFRNRLEIKTSNTEGSSPNSSTFSLWIASREHCLCSVYKSYQTRVELPPDYNDVGTWPVIRFTSTVFNPMVSPTTGVVDLKHAFPEWIPAKQHYMVAALTQVKKIFYMKEFPYHQVPNPEAQALFQVNMVKSLRGDGTISLEPDAAII